MRARPCVARGAAKQLKLEDQLGLELGSKSKVRDGTKAVRKGSGETSDYALTALDLTELW